MLSITLWWYIISTKQWSRCTTIQLSSLEWPEWPVKTSDFIRSSSNFIRFVTFYAFWELFRNPNLGGGRVISLKLNDNSNFRLGQKKTLKKKPCDLKTKFSWAKKFQKIWDLFRIRFGTLHAFWEIYEGSTTSEKNKEVSRKAISDKPFRIYY